MCGIALIAGDGADDAEFRAMLAALRPRGEVTEVASGARLMAGTRRLRIVDRERAAQPWLSAGGRWLLCFNGEIYNHRELRAELTGLGREFRTGSDTEVVAEAFGQWGEDAVRQLRGEFAFAIAERDSGRVYLARDLVGVKPLYWSPVAGRLHVASEIKALVTAAAPAGAPVREVPPGSHGWAEPGREPRLRHYSARLDPAAADAGLPALDDAAEAAALIRETLADAIAVRLDTDLPVGVILSGGLDSTLTLLHVREQHPDCVAFTVGTAGSEDVRYARRLTRDLGVRHEVIELAPRQLRLAQISEAIRISELTEYGDIINAVVSVPLFRRIAECGIKVVLTGDGSDELFGGYPMYDQVPPAQARRLFLHKIANLGRTELQRVDRTSMASGVEARVPFLDPAMVEVAHAAADVAEGARRRGEVDPAPGLRRHAARLHQGPAQEPDVARLRAARAGQAVQARVRADPPLVRL